MSKTFDKLLKSYESIRSKTSFVPQIALVLGSGLGDYAEGVEIACTIAYEDIMEFPKSTVPGHRGRFVCGYVNNVSVIIMQGRVHFYEGYSIEEVVMPVRLMHMMGARGLILTNASGGINTAYAPGDFMLISDHILFNVPSPLVGKNIDELGTRFPDMSDVYSKNLRRAVRETADSLHINLHEGVYLQASGPNFESPAEIRAYGILGADVVGMSTACEAVAANHAGMKICGISCVTNMGAGIAKNSLTYKEVQETADKVAPDFKRLITASIERISQLI